MGSAVARACFAVWIVALTGAYYLFPAGRRAEDRQVLHRRHDRQPQQRALVNAIVTLARNLDLAVVAEGIEDAPQRALLARMGCPYGQGYLFSRPAWPDDILTLIAAPLAVSA